MTQIDLYDLEIGDRFMQDTYPEIYKVIRKEPGTAFPLVIAQDLETGEESEWGYHPDYYGPTIIKL